jgi:hypothetical protein
MSNAIMSVITTPRTVATGFVIAAVAAVLLIGGPAGDEPPASLQLSRPTSVTEAPTRVAETAAPAARDTPAAARVRELNAMSESFRNTTFLIAIRDAGFFCNELLRVYGGLDDAPKWVASCSEMFSYTVGVASDGSLRVEPMMQYFDGLTPAVPLDGERALPPQPLPAPR